MIHPIVIPEEWKTAAEILSDQTGVFMVLGIPDSGKSTLITYLIQYYSQTHPHRPIAFVDSDLGQSHLGPPTTIGMIVFTGPKTEMDSLNPDLMKFIGAPSPVGHFQAVVLATQELVEQASASGAEKILVNTSGLILGPEGAGLKLNKIDSIHPEVVIALQEASELDQLLKDLEGCRIPVIIRLPVSSFAKKRNAGIRQAYREQLYREYFKESKMIKWPVAMVEEWSIHLKGESKSVHRDLKYRLLGLCDSEDHLLGLGILKGFDPVEGVIHIMSPLDPKTSAKGKKVVLGSIFVHPERYEEHTPPYGGGVSGSPLVGHKR